MSTDRIGPRSKVIVCKLLCALMLLYGQPLLALPLKATPRSPAGISEILHLDELAEAASGLDRVLVWPDFEIPAPLRTAGPRPASAGPGGVPTPQTTASPGSREENKSYADLIGRPCEAQLAQLGRSGL